MGLKDRITDDMKDAMRAKDSARPANLAFAAAMTLPMSPAPLAPVSATSAATSAAIKRHFKRVRSMQLPKKLF